MHWIVPKVDAELPYGRTFLPGIIKGFPSVVQHIPHFFNGLFQNSVGGAFGPLGSKYNLIPACTIHDDC